MGFSLGFHRLEVRTIYGGFHKKFDVSLSPLETAITTWVTNPDWCWKPKSLTGRGLLNIVPVKFPSSPPCLQNCCQNSNKKILPFYDLNYLIYFLFYITFNKSSIFHIFVFNLFSFWEHLLKRILIKIKSVNKKRNSVLYKTTKNLIIFFSN